MHYLVTEGALGSDKRGFIHVYKNYLYLVITGESIHEWKDRELSGVVYQYVDMWQREVVFRTGSIQIFIVYTHYDFSIFLWDWHNVSDPLWILGND